MAVNWYGNQVLIQITNASRQMLVNAGLQVEAYAKRNIVQNNQVDTGFMLNCTYTSGPGANTYSPPAMADKQAAPAASAPADGVVVGNAASYAVYQENADPFLFPALEQVVADLPGIAKMVIQ